MNYKVSCFSINEELLKETLDLVRKHDTDFSKYVRNALRRENKRMRDIKDG